MRGRSPIMTTRLPKHTGICARIQCRQVFCKFQQVFGKCRDWVTQSLARRMRARSGDNPGRLGTRVLGYWVTQAYGQASMLRLVPAGIDNVGEDLQAPRS